MTTPDLLTAALAALPVLLTAAVLLAGRGSLLAASVATPAAAVLALWQFRPEAETARSSFLDYAPVLAEVLLILLFGMVLAQLLQASGAMRRIGDWLLASSPSLGAGTALVVLGIVPFAESVTGFGIGVTVGVPLLAHMGHGIVRAAVLGLCGLVMVPWGALAPGTTVAASLTGLDLTELGIATAGVNVVPLVVVAAVTAALSHVSGAGRQRSERQHSGRALLATLGWTALAAVVLGGGVLAANIVLGTPPAGVLGSGAVICVLLVLFRLRGTRAAADAALGRALLPYGVLTAGLLLAQLVTRGLAEALPAWLAHGLAAPPLWLAIGAGTAFVLMHRAQAAPAVTDPPAQALRRGLRAWLPVGTATGLFMLMGWVMTVSGMSAAIGTALAGLGPGAAPVLSAVGGVLTGSNTGANAMFASTTAVLAESADASVLVLVAAGNAAASISTLAAPSRVAMAAALAASAQDAASAQEAPGDAARRERAVLLRALAVVAVAVAGLAALAAGL
ncbi:L-lactate permease [Brevibacterium sp.]|uniref:L-lactate permease n=1 Tax=Brevibacterium sp. TaxID=1701 RepID=UPI0025BC4BF7|nr:L-lactate permease [Brevibacterium sp.]